MPTLTVGSGKQYATIASALTTVPTVLDAPYVIEVYDGTYTDQIYINARTMTNVNTLTIKAATGNHPIIDVTGTEAIWARLSSYTTIEGFDVRSDHGPSVRLDTMPNSVIQKCILRTQGTYNYLHLVGNLVRIENCIFISPTADLCIQAQLVTNGGIYNCTFYGLPHATLGLVRVTGTTPDIKNNIIFVTGGSELAIVDDTGKGVYSNNIYYSSAGNLKLKYNGTVHTTFSNWVTASGDTNSFNQDPKLTNPSNNDFTLLSDSPAINQGFNTGLTEDFTGSTRDASIDIGAYEFQTETPGNGPLLCWQLTAKYKGSKRLFHLNGSGPHPSQFTLPPNIDLNSVLLIDEGIPIPNSNYKIL